MISDNIVANIVLLEDYLYEDEAYQKEKYYISKFKNSGYKLCNHNNGGMGRLGEKMSEDTRRKMSDSRKGRKPKAESIQKMVKTRIERGSYKFSDESKLKMSNSQSNRYENYICIDSSGNRFNVNNLRLFCSKHGLSKCRMGQIAKSWRGIFYNRNDGYGKKIHLSHKGWKCFYESDFCEDYWKYSKFLIKNQCNQIFYVTNLTEFAKENGLSADLLQRVSRSGGVYRGYTVSKNPIYLEKYSIPAESGNDNNRNR